MMFRYTNDFDGRIAGWQSMETLDLDVVRGRSARRLVHRLVAAAMALILVAGGVRLSLARIHTQALAATAASNPVPVRKVTWLVDPVCKHRFDASKATGYCRIDGHTIYFDHPECQRAFTLEPLKYAHVRLQVHARAADVQTDRPARPVAQAKPHAPVQVAHAPVQVAHAPVQVAQAGPPQEAAPPAPEVSQPAAHLQPAPVATNGVAADAPSVNEPFPDTLAP